MTNLKHFTFIVFAVFSNFISQLYFKKTSEIIKHSDLKLDEVTELILKISTNYLFWIGIIFFFIGAILWLLGLKKISLGQAFSISSLNYLFVGFHSYFFLDENISIQKIVSIILLIIAVSIFNFKTQTNF